MRFYIALIVAKCIRILIKIVGKMFKINGSHFPGNVANKICPDFLNKVGKPKKIITVTGTNGKTTTCNLIIDSLEMNGYKVLNNKYGSNVKGGITTTFLSGVNLRNKAKYEIAVLEIDERSSAKIYPYINPTYSVVTNLFRDSMKRNAHSEFIFDIINNTIPEGTNLILNANDLISNRMNKEKDNEKTYFGINKLENENNEEINVVNDARVCPNCYSKLKYNFIRYHHIGEAYCEKCGYKSPKADYNVININFEEQYMTVSHNEKEYKVKIVSDSIFNIYNEIAAITVLSKLGLTDEQIIETFEKIKITKERYEEETINERTIIKHLAKGQNPLACSIVFKYMKEEKDKKEIILLVEDYHDNKESSENIAWFYDCDFEFLNDEKIEKIIIGGHRAEDIKLRCLIAGIPERKIIVSEDESKIPDHLSYKKDNKIYILYDMYQQPNVDKVDKLIKEKIEKN